MAFFRTISNPAFSSKPAAYGLALLLFASASLPAQTHPASAGATLSGHVVLADTDRPARFAAIYLKPVDPPDPGQDFFTVLMNSAISNMQSKQSASSSIAAADADAQSLKAAQTAAGNFLASVTDSMLYATINAEGDYSITGIPPGAYYLHVKAPGYVDALAQFTQQDLTSADPSVRKRILAAVPTILVAAQEHVREDLRLERGAALSGRLRYDDGSPAVGWTVTAMLKRNAAQAPPPTIFGIDLSQVPIGQKLDHVLSDDQGRFRIAGLPAGEFTFQATLLTAALDRQPFAPIASSSGSFLSILGGVSALSALRLSVYSGGKIHLHDADTYPLRSGEERSSPDLIVPLAATHSIQGFLVAQADGHPINGGTIELIGLDSERDEDPNLHFSAEVHADGSFRFDYIAGPSSYKLVVVRAADTSVTSVLKLLGSAVAQHSIRRTYAPATLQVELKDSDLTGIKIAVAENQAALNH